jgi:hypothetical protein
VYNDRMERMVGLALVGVVASVSVARADAPSPFDVRVPAGMSRSRTAPQPDVTAADVVVDHNVGRRHAAAWTAVGGVALLGTSFAVSLVEGGRWKAAVARGDIDTANDARDVARYVGTPLFVGGVAALGVAAVLYVTAPRNRERRVIVAPAAGADQLGLAISGGF